jgi:hypothetical protein
MRQFYGRLRAVLFVGVVVAAGALAPALVFTHHGVAPMAQTAGDALRDAAGSTARPGPGTALGPAKPLHLKPHQLFLTRAHSAVFNVRKLKSTVVKVERPEHEDPFGPRDGDADAGGSVPSDPQASGTSSAGMPASLAQEQMVQKSVQADASLPTTDSSFDGLDFNTWGAGHPPDENGDVGPTYYIQTVNTSIGIYNKSNGTRVAAFTFNAFMSQGNFGNLCDTNNFGDPIVLYDSYEDRWMIADFAFKLDGSGNVSPQTVFECIAVSKTGDPVNGGWNYYSILAPGGLADYPKFGIWPDGIYMSANMFGYSAGGSYLGYHVWALNKQQMYADAPQVSVVDFAGDTSDFTVLPVNSKLAAGAPPVGSPEYFVSTDLYLNALAIYKFQVNWDKISTSTFTGPFAEGAPNCWPNVSPSNASTPANAADVLPLRAMAAPEYTNQGGTESVWVAHTVDRGTYSLANCGGSTAGNATIRWYQANVTGGTIAANLTQGSSFDPEGANTYFRFQPALAVDRVGDMAVTYTKSNSTTNPQVMYEGRLAGDPANTLGTEATLMAGTGAQSGMCGTSTCVRWGDYAGMELDPNGCEFWMTGEYFATTGLNDQTRIGSFHYPGCTTVGNGTLSGTVTDGASPISGATVTLGSRTTTSDGSGQYSFSVPAGTYPSLLADQPGYAEGSAATLVVPDGGTLTKNFTLSKATQSGCFTDNSQSLFQRGVPSVGCDLTASAGNVILAKPLSVDQQATSNSGSGFNVTTTQWIGQTFVPAISGKLSKIGMSLFCSACSGTDQPLTVQVRTTSASLPTSTVLATATIPGFSSGSSVTYTATFASQPTLTAGTKYAFIVKLATARTGTYDAIYSAGPNADTTGDLVATVNSGSSWSIPTVSGTARDMQFTTYMSTGFNPSGTFVSSMRDANPAAGRAAHWTTLSFTANTPANTAVKFQVAGSNNAYGPWNYVGPDGTASTFFTTSGADLSEFNGDRYLRYEAFLSSSDPTVTPSISSVQTCFQDVLPGVASTLVASSASGTYGGTTTLTATLTSGGPGVPGETVNFTLNGTSVGGATTDANGVATLQNVSLAGIDAGSYPAGVAAFFDGDSNYQSSSGSNSLTVSKADQAILISTHAPTDANYGDQFTVAATGGGSGNAVTYGSSGACTNTGATFTITSGTGLCTVTYNQAGNTDYNDAPQLTENVNGHKVNQAIQITTHAPVNAAYGAGFTVAATAGSGDPVAFGSSGACTNVGANFTMTSGTGTCTVTYDQAGNGNYNPASQQTESVTAQKAAQTINVTVAAPSTAAYNSSFDVTANAPGGPVAFSSSGVCSSAGAHFTMTSGTGTCTVHFNNAGDPNNYNAAPEVTESVTATKIDQSITFATPGAHTYGNPNFDPGATASSGFAVSYGASGACSIVGGKVHFTGAGSCTVTASQAGDANYKAAQVQRMFSVGKASLSITAGDRQKYFDQGMSLGTTAYTSSGLVGSDSVSGVTLTSSGTAATAASGSYPIVASNAVAGPSTNLGADYTVTYHSGTLRVYPAGIIALNGVSVATRGGKIDSFNSSAGPYGSLTNHGSAAAVISNGPVSLAGVALLGSALSTHGAVSVSHTASVSGKVTAGTTASILGKVSGAVTRSSPSGALALPTVTTCAGYSAKTGISGGKFTYTPRNGNLTIKRGTVKLASKTYCFNNITLAARSTLSVSGPVAIHLQGKLTSKGQIANTTSLPAALRIDTRYTGSNGVAIVGGNQAVMALLAPKTTVTISGGSFFGTLIAGTVKLTGRIAFHADQH